MGKKPRKSKVKGVNKYKYAHFVRRVRERFAITITEQDVKFLLNELQDGNMEHVYTQLIKQATERTWHKYEFKGHLMYLCYAGAGQGFVTVYDQQFWDVFWNSIDSLENGARRAERLAPS